jgi:DnaJ-domain-containing protein 1
MIKDIVKSEKPEEKELRKKRAELDSLEDQLVQQELELTTLLAELREFEARYLNIVGVRYAELDEIEAKIAEAQAKMNPKDKEAAYRFAQARNRAEESAKATGNITEMPLKDKVKPSDSLKKLYREVARKVHPDLCTDEQERLRREKLMAEANRAYEEGDEEHLQRILDEWESSPESIKGEDVGAELVRVLRKIAQVESRFSRINSEIETVHQSDLYQLKVKIEEAKDSNQDPLAELAAALDAEISEAKKRLRIITQKKKNE